MDDWRMSIYLRELTHQGEVAQIAAVDLNAALGANVEGIPRAFAAVQSLLAAGAMVSKMLWPQPSKGNPDGSILSDQDVLRRKATIDRGKDLRKALSIKAIPVLESRKVRNAFEHFDDRLDRYFEDGKTIVVDRNIGPRDRMVVIGDAPAPHLRLIDPQAGTVSVMDDEVVMQELFDAVSDVSRRASEWLAAHKM